MDQLYCTVNSQIVAFTSVAEESMPFFWLPLFPIYTQNFLHNYLLSWISILYISTTLHWIIPYHGHVMLTVSRQIALDLCTQTTHMQLTSTVQMLRKSTTRTWEGSTHVICTGLDLLVQFVLVLVPEGRVAHQQDVQDHTWHTHKIYMNICPNRYLWEHEFSSIQRDRN